MAVYSSKCSRSSLGGPHDNQLQFRVPFQNILKHITQAPWGALGGEHGQVSMAGTFNRSIPTMDTHPVCRKIHVIACLYPSIALLQELVRQQDTTEPSHQGGTLARPV